MRVEVLGLRVEGVGFGVSNLGIFGQGAGFRVCFLGFVVSWEKKSGQEAETHMSCCGLLS